MGCSPHVRFDQSNSGTSARCRSRNPRTLNDGQLDAALDDAGANGVAGESGGVVDVQLLHEMFAMLLDGLDADAEFGRSLLVGLAFGDQLEHFHLARSQLGSFLVEQSRTAGRWWIETVATTGN